MDEQAVSADGELVWAFTNTAGKIQLTTTSKKQPGIDYTPLATCEALPLRWMMSLRNLGTSTIHSLKKMQLTCVLKTDGYARCSRLARSHPGSEFAQNSGPEMATKTAETYAYFAMMA